MRSWKTAETPAQVVFLYFRAHPEILFAPEHIAAQVKIGEKQVRRIIKSLEKLGKVHGMKTQASQSWGRPRFLYQAVRATDDSLDQLEIQTEPGPGATLVYSAFTMGSP